MSIERMAVLDSANIVVNIIVYDTEALWSPSPETHIVQASNKGQPEAQIGGRWDGSRFISFVPTAAQVAAAAQATADDAVIKDVLLEKGRQTLANWDGLFFTSSQKFAVVKALLTYMLRKEGG